MNMKMNVRIELRAAAVRVMLLQGETLDDALALADRYMATRHADTVIAHFANVTKPPKCARCGFFCDVEMRASSSWSNDRRPHHRCRNHLCESRAFAFRADEPPEKIAELAVWTRRQLYRMISGNRLSHEPTETYAALEVGSLERWSAFLRRKAVVVDDQPNTNGEITIRLEYCNDKYTARPGVQIRPMKPGELPSYKEGSKP